MDYDYCRECLEECRACTDPCNFCKSRPQCLIWELCGREAKKRCQEKEEAKT